ncbi:MAG TPA: hypothetical protein VF177_08080 [Anaerolineae bacterium]
MLPHPSSHFVLTLAGSHLLGPAEPPLWPDTDALSWHGRQIFRRR